MTSSMIGGLISSVEKAKGAVFGDYSSSFDDLRWYVDTANDANPGSVLDMEFDVDSKGRHFKRLFFAFETCLYLLCFAIVDNESYNNWHWFLSKLLVILTPGRDIVFVTNRHGGKRHGEMCTNVAESFNSWIRDECHLFSTSLVNAVRIIQLWLILGNVLVLVNCGKLILFLANMVFVL
ncbi:hypothetical protein ACSBR1_038000 [Camellia fascicularis]